MLPPVRPGIALRSLVLSCALVFGLLVGTPGTAQAATKAPSGLSVRSYSNNAVRLTWKPVAKAAGYEVKYASNSRLKRASLVKVTATVVEIGGLKASRKYYFKVRALKADGTALTSYGKTRKIKTRSKKSYPALSPASLSAIANYGDELTMSWAPQGTTNRYLLRWATKKSMKKAESRTVTGTTTVLEGLKRGTPYYLTVEVRSDRNKSLSQRTSVVKVTTAKLISFGTPTGVVVSRVNPTDITVSWNPVRKAPLYRISYTAGDGDTGYIFTGGTTTLVSGLVANTGYAVSVQAVDAASQPAGEFSPAVAVTTPTAEAALRVASYNIHCHTCSPSIADPAANDQPWTIRRDYVIEAIRKADPDVVALQEAQQSWLDDPNDSGSRKLDLSQFEDLTQRLGNPWELTNKNRNNCVKSKTPTDCVYADQGASNGTKVIFNSARLVLKRQGSTLLPSASSDNPGWTDPDPYPRWVAWAVFQQRSTGKQFLFADIHLEPRNDDGSDNPYPGTTFFGNIRRAQSVAALTRLGELNSAGLPIVLAGDAASSRAEFGGNLPYPVLTTQLVDPLGGMSYNAPATAPAGTRINIAFNSVNKYDRVARRYTPSGERYDAAKNSAYNGAYNDYILVSPSIRIAEFEQVVDVDAYGRFVGVIPSDHNLIRATLWLP